MKRSLILQVLLIFMALVLKGQTPTQTIRGKVIDGDTQLPLTGVTVQILQPEQLTGTITDENGLFRLNNVPVGRVSLLITIIGYQDKIIPEVEVNSAKEVVLEISLVESVQMLKEIVMKKSRNKGDASNDLAIVSARSISSEQTSRYAGGFNDPSKITSNFAGVATSQDGGNEIIIRGNSPKYIQWRLEGSQISNPNHFGDQNGISGIVNALNNNLLSTSDFYTGAFPAEFGDALSGVYDIRMRKGNNEKFEGIAGLGVLGTDLTVEGPFRKGYGGSFLANYRYSTLGLASDLKIVNVDGADLNFQDGAFKLWLPTERFGEFSIYGLNGKSNFIFKDVTPAVWVTPGEDFAQTSLTEDYKKGAFLSNTGINHTINILNDGYLKTSVIYSREGVKDKVFENTGDDDESVRQRLNFNSSMVRSSYRISSVFNYKFNTLHKINVGLRYNLIHQNMNQSQLDQSGERVTVIDFNEGINTLQSFINWRFSPSEKLIFVTGLHNTNVLYNNKHTIEPRFAVNYKLTPSNTFSLGYGNHSRMESVHNYFTETRLQDGSIVHPNQDLGLLRAHHFVTGYEKYFGKNIRLKLEAYYQSLYNIPVENDVHSSYSTLNEDLELKYVDLVNKGTGKNYGIEFTFERFLNKGYYYLFNATVYDSRYTALDKVERNTKFNQNYLVNFLAGKEFSGLGKKDNQTFAVNIKTFFGGGKYYIPVIRDSAGNAAADVSKGLIYDESKAFQNKLDDIVNIVFSVSYKWNLRKTTHEIYINIDNVTNHRARLNEFYDTTSPGGINYEKQVGMVPNILYRLYF